MGNMYNYNAIILVQSKRIRSALFLRAVELNSKLANKLVLLIIYKLNNINLIENLLNYSYYESYYC